MVGLMVGWVMVVYLIEQGYGRVVGYCRIMIGHLWGEIFSQIMVVAVRELT
jgi:hypothetical protein